MIGRLDDDLVRADAVHLVVEPLAGRLEVALDAQRRELVGDDAERPARPVRPASRAGGPRESRAASCPRCPGRTRSCRPRATTGSALKSDGRRARSVEMMTHRPTTGSFADQAWRPPTRTSSRVAARPSSEASASAGGLPSKSTAATSVAIGSAVPCCAASATAAPTVARPRPPCAWPAGRLHGCPARQRHAERAIARQRPGAGQHQVAESGQPRQRRRLAAQRDRQPRDLGQAARDQRGARVLAQPEAVGEPGRHGDHVLERPADLDADDVAVGVEPELARAETPLQLGGQRVVAARDHRGRGLPQRHLAGERGARQHRHARGGPAAGDHLAHAPVADRVEALGRRHHRRRHGAQPSQGLARRTPTAPRSRPARRAATAAAASVVGSIALGRSTSGRYQGFRRRARIASTTSGCARKGAPARRCARGGSPAPCPSCPRPRW